MRRLAIFSLFVFAACGGSSSAPPKTPAAQAAANEPPPPVHMPLAPAPPEDLTTLGPPGAHCQADEPMPALPYVDTAPVNVTSTAKGISLETQGASAGRVLAAIAAQSKHGIDARGPGAAVRIYARLKDATWDAAVKMVADAAGLDVVAPKADDPLAVTIVLDPRAAREESQRQRAEELATAPLETRLIPSKHAADVAPVIAMTLLTCRGRVTGVPAHGLIAVTDVKEVLDHVSELVATVDASPPKPLHIEMARTRVALWGGRAQRCAEVPQAPAPSVTGAARLSAEGTAAGDLLFRVARSEGKDVVVGCGGDRPAYFAPTGATPATADVARALGLRAVTDGVYASDDLSPRQPPAPEEAMQILAGFAVHDARELANIADDLVGDPSAAVPYEPASLLVVSAGASDMARVQELVKAWATR